MASLLEEARSSEDEEFSIYKRRKKMMALKKRKISDSLEESWAIKKAKKRISTKSPKKGRKKCLHVKNSSDDGSQKSFSMDYTNQKSDKRRKREDQIKEIGIDSGMIADRKRRKTSGEGIHFGDSRRRQERAGGSGVQEAAPGETVSSYIKRLSFCHLLGQGSFGKVLLAEDSLTGQRLAVKVIKKRKLLLKDPELVFVERRVLEVASGSAFLIHGHLAFQTTNHLFLGLEYASGGDLYQFLQRKGCLDITSATFYAAEITCGVQHLHSKGIIHRDLKPDNILMAESGHLKIADFGLAIDNIFGDQTATAYAGTPGYMAPEMLAGEEYNAGVDWYSFGVIINEMITGTRRYHPRRFHKAGAVAKDIVKQLLCKNPSRRLGANGNIRQHPLFQRMDWVSLEALRLPPPHVPDPPTIEHSSRGCNIEEMEAAEAQITPLSSIDQELFRGFSYVGSNWRTIPRTPAFHLHGARWPNTWKMVMERRDGFRLMVFVFMFIFYVYILFIS